MDRKAWHPAYCSAIEYELREARKHLVFESEHCLSKEPLRVDELVIIKEPGIVINNELAYIFRTHNMFEFKSPKDDLSVDDFSRTIWRAWLYKSFGKTDDAIPVDEITVSCERYAKPVKLLKWLEDKYNVENPALGIYYVEGLGFPCQVIVTKELREEHAALKVLSERASEEDMARFLMLTLSGNSVEDSRNLSAIAHVSFEANADLLRKLKGDGNMSAALEELMKEELADRWNRGKAEGKAEGKTEGVNILANIIRLIKSGASAPEIAARGYSPETISLAFSLV